MWGWQGRVLSGLWAIAACAELPEAGEQGSGQHALALLHTSDLHSHVWPFRERISELEGSLGLGPPGTLQELGGFARLAFVVGREQAGGTALWLDSGDALEGSEVFERLGGRLELQLLSDLGLGAMALGNHELSLPGPELGSLLANVRFPVLAANLAPEAASPLEGRLGQSVLLDVEGIKVGVVGVANPTSPPHLSQAGNPWGLGLAATAAAAAQVAIDDVLPRAELIVVLSHLGLDGDRELVRDTSGIDLVLGGHQHIVTREPEWQDDCASWAIAERGCVSRRVPIVHSGAYGKLVSRLELSLTRRAWLASSCSSCRSAPAPPNAPTCFSCSKRYSRWHNRRSASCPWHFRAAPPWAGIRRSATWWPTPCARRRRPMWRC